jgi:hypothetical protein
VIIDVVDATEASDRHEVETIRAAGGTPIVLYGMCGAVEHIVHQIIKRAGFPGRIKLLRFHGHGAPGAMNVAAGREDYDVHHSGFSTANLSSTTGPLSKLTPYFGPRGRVELHGCKVAMGPEGQKLLRRLAKIWGVPVTAGTENQLGGGADQFTFEGPVHTAMPNGNMMCGIPY